MQPNVRVQIVAHTPLGGTGFRLRTQGGQVRLSSASSVVPQRQGTTWSLLTGWQAAERLQCFTTPCSLRCGVSWLQRCERLRLRGQGEIEGTKFRA